MSRELIASPSGARGVTDAERLVLALAELSAAFRESLTPETVAVYAKYLARFAVQDVASAAEAYILAPREQAQFFPRIGDLVERVRRIEADRKRAVEQGARLREREERDALSPEARAESERAARAAIEKLARNVRPQIGGAESGEAPLDPGWRDGVRRAMGRPASDEAKTEGEPE